MCVYKHVLVALGLRTACGHVQASEPVPSAGAATAMFYSIEWDDTKVAELAGVAPVAASTLLLFRAQPTIDPVDMCQNVSYFSAKPNARSVRAVLDGDGNGFRFADPLGDGVRLRAIFRTIDDAGTQDGHMTLSIEAIGDDTAERTTLVALEQVEGATVSVDIAEDRKSTRLNSS